jgi:hypothetical protein
MTKEAIKDLKANGNGFNKWYRTVSLELIGGLLCLLMTILICVIGWNYVQDGEAHTLAIKGIARLEAGKIGVTDLQPLRDDIQNLCNKHDHDVDRMSDKLDKAVDEIKRIVMKKYQ